MKATIYPITVAAPNRIAIVARPRGGDWLGDEIRALASAGIDVLVSMLTEEESKDLGLERESDDCGAAAITFVNLPVPDRSVPPDTDGFLHAIERLAQLTATAEWGAHRSHACMPLAGMTDTLQKLHKRSRVSPEGGAVSNLLPRWSQPTFFIGGFPWQYS